MASYLLALILFEVKNQSGAFGKSLVTTAALDVLMRCVHLVIASISLEDRERGIRGTHLLNVPIATRLALEVDSADGANDVLLALHFVHVQCLIVVEV